MYPLLGNRYGANHPSSFLAAPILEATGPLPLELSLSPNPKHGCAYPAHRLRL